ncbi:MAG: T9SS type A sorting domain-containing protein [Flavobacterium sp.]
MRQTSLFIKNGTNEIILDFSNNPNLQYICCDEGQLSAVQNTVNTLGYTNCNVNTYCSFTPGGTFYTIQGSNKFDSNNNGCDANDLALPNVKFNITNGTVNGSFISNNSGNYNIPVQAGTHTITPQLENPTYFTVTPASTQVIFPVTPSPFMQNYCIAPTGVHQDLEVVFAPINPARPGFDATYRLVYKNKGNQVMNGTINLTFQDEVLDLVSTSLATSSQQTNQLNWAFNNLLPLQTRFIDLVFNVNSPQETPAVNNGDQLNFVATINPITGDEIPNDNTSSLKQIVVGSYDPNDITCLEGPQELPENIGDYLHYVIRFENTGTYAAENVVVKTIINPAHYNINSLQFLNSSHNTYTRITGNVVEFIFENINLAAASGGGGGGHGHVIIKIKPNNSLEVNSSVTSQANIYFDYNFPIVTNEETTVFQNLSINDNPLLEVSIFPNPVKDILQLQSKEMIQNIELYDVQGRILEATQVNSEKVSHNISHRNNGIYFVKISTELGTKTVKIIKN